MFRNQLEIVSALRDVSALREYQERICSLETKIILLECKISENKPSYMVTECNSCLRYRNELEELEKVIQRIVNCLNPANSVVNSGSTDACGISRPIGSL